MKKLDINALLQEQQLEISLNGHTYFVDDVPMHKMREIEKIANEATTENWDLAVVAQLALLLDVDNAELESLGVRAATFALRAIQEFISAEINPTKPAKS